MKLEKQKYYSSLVLENEKDQKQLFKIVKDLSKESKQTTLPKYDSDAQLADDFGDYFIEKVDKIREKFPTTTDFDKYDKHDESFASFANFEPVSAENVKKLVMQSPSKSCLLDPIPTNLLKQCLNELQPTITRIVNLSLEEGKMPDDLKHAVVTPLLKKQGADLIFKNFRPVSGLPFLSKIIEKVVSQQLNAHVVENNLDENLQSAYKPKHSTETALTKIMNDLLLESDRQRVVLLAFLDLSAAFDTVDQEEDTHKLCASRICSRS